MKDKFYSNQPNPALQGLLSYRTDDKNSTEVGPFVCYLGFLEVNQPEVVCMFETLRAHLNSSLDSIEKVDAEVRHTNSRIINMHGYVL